MENFGTLLLSNYNMRQVNTELYNTGSRLQYALTLVAMAQYIHVLSNIDVEIITLKIVLKYPTLP